VPGSPDHHWFRRRSSHHSYNLLIAKPRIELGNFSLTLRGAERKKRPNSSETIHLQWRKNTMGDTSKFIADFGVPTFYNQEAPWTLTIRDGITFQYH